MKSASSLYSAPTQRDLSLEAVRGLSCLIVYVWHFILAFYPALVLNPDEGLLGSPFYALIHGTAAVGIFFLISGYVLTRRYFETRDVVFLISHAAKRWFRLVPLVTLSVLLSWALYHFSLYGYEDATKITNSAWLTRGGGAGNPPKNGSFYDALLQGVWGTFVHGDFSFNSNLWVIKFEMIGSLMSLSFAWIVMQTKKNFKARVFVIVLCVIAACLVHVRYALFMSGTLLALTMPRRPKIGTMPAFVMIILGLYFLGYRYPCGAYSFLQALVFFDPEDVYVMTSLIGGMLILIPCLGGTSINQALKKPFSGFLGKISFSLFLLHIIVICSLGAKVFLYVYENSSGDYWGAVLITALVITPMLIILSHALAQVDLWWNKLVNRCFAALVAKF